MATQQKQDHQPTRVIVPTNVVHEQPSGCCCGHCGVPGNASSDVKNTRRISIALIIIHIVGMLSWWFQFIGNAIGIIMGSIVLCSFKKCTYMTAGFLYILGFIIDLASLGLLSVLLVEYNDDEDEFDDLSTGFIIFMLVPPALGALCFLLGSVFAFKASCAWEKSGAPGTLPV